MQRYIEQLIDDLHKATWNIRPPHTLWEDSGADPDNELERDDLSYVEKYVYGDETPISGITGISQEQLPPPEKLNHDQQALLAVELEKHLQYFHFCLDFPIDYPAHLRYPFIWKFWSENQVALSFGENHIEFCDYDEEHCPFPGYCNTCKEVAERMKYEEESEKSNGADFDIDNILPTPKEIEDWFMQQKKNDQNDIDHPHDSL